MAQARTHTHARTQTHTTVIKTTLNQIGKYVNLHISSDKTVGPQVPYIDNPRVIHLALPANGDVSQAWLPLRVPSLILLRSIHCSGGLANVSAGEVTRPSVSSDDLSSCLLLEEVAAVAVVGESGGASLSQNNYAFSLFDDNSNKKKCCRQRRHTGMG